MLQFIGMPITCASDLINDTPDLLPADGITPVKVGHLIRMHVCTSMMPLHVHHTLRTLVVGLKCN
jgi:hypothetical protein